MSSTRALSVVLLALACCGRPPPESFRTEAVSRGAVTEVVSATGEVSAIITVNIGSQVSGTISHLLVDFNSQVKKGQLLAEIDPRLFRAAFARADAGLASAKASVEKAQAALNDALRQEKRAQELFDAKLTSRADLDTAIANREQAQASLSVAKAQVLQASADRDTAAANLAYTRITSPIDGIIVSRAVDVGQTVAASFQTPTLFTIAGDLTKMQILANIDEADVGKVREQMETRFTVDAWPGETFTGHIREVRQAPNTIQNVVTYQAVIDAPNPERKLRQGMTTSVQIQTGRRDDVLRVPNAALRFKPTAAPLAGPEQAEAGAHRGPGRDGAPRDEKGHEGRGRDGTGERGGMRVAGAAEGHEPPADEAPKRRPGRPGRIYKLVDGKPVATQVRLGLSDSQRTEVLEGLAENDLVVVGELGGAAASQGSSLTGMPRPPGGGGSRRAF